VAAFHEYVADSGRNEGSAYDVNDHLETLPLNNLNAYLNTMLENTGESERFLRERWALSRKFIDSKELRGAALEGFLRTPREHFVREKNVARSYADTWMPIGYGATITDPDVVAMMTTTLDVKPQHKVLEIGTGSGYQSAILSNLSNHVYSIEIIKPLFFETNELYEELSTEYPQYRNISRKLGDGYFGWEKFAPFDRIIVTCSIDHLPPPLLQQLKPGGIMVVPLGNPSRQYIMEVKKSLDAKGNEVLTRRDVYNGLSVKFIPFRDEEGQSYSGSDR
jgi:protein-L-isoaspartate(D-aspartate) O-methyltransferase